MIRKDNDLIYHHRISLKDALCSSPIEFETLDGETIKFAADSVINPNT